MNKVAVHIQGLVSVYDIVPNVKVTNNEAEYLAVFYALLFHKDITEIASDSQLVVQQLRGDWCINKENLQTMYFKIQHLNSKYHHSKMIWTWVSREQNPAGLHLDKLLKARKQYERDYYKS